MAQVYSEVVCVALSSGKRGWICSDVNKSKAAFTGTAGFLMGQMRGFLRGPGNQCSWPKKAAWKASGEGVF